MTLPPYTRTREGEARQLRSGPQTLVVLTVVNQIRYHFVAMFSAPRSKGERFL